jgi:hypothetical protein
VAALAGAGKLLAKRRHILRKSRISEAAFADLLRKFSIPARDLAGL